MQVKTRIECEKLTKEELINEYINLSNYLLKNNITKQIATKDLDITHEQKSNTIDTFINYFSSNPNHYAELWTDKNGKEHYGLKCKNRFSDICFSRKFICKSCENKQLSPLTKDIYLKHLDGSVSIGIYPMMSDSTTKFLAFDFDEANALIEVTQFCCILKQHSIDYIVEISRSGKGYHVWIFFEDYVPAKLARKLGTYLLSESIDKFNITSFKSFDRMFPSQDTLSDDGVGNLIALPMQGKKNKNNCTVFLDENFIPSHKKFDELFKIKKLSKKFIIEITKNMNEKTLFDEEVIKTLPVPLSQNDFNYPFTISIGSGIGIPLRCLNKKSMTLFKKMSSFWNPEFFKMQSLRKIIYAKNFPRVISCYTEDEHNLILPRGLSNKVTNMLDELDVKYTIKETFNIGKTIDIQLKTTLREDQLLFLNQILKKQCGICIAPTGFGKTIVALALITKKQTNTLIIVNKYELAKQWVDKIEQYVSLNYNVKKGSKVGLLSSKKKHITNYIDIALIGTLKNDKYKHLITNYGLVICDEVHHASSNTYAEVMRYCNANNIYGFTATNERSDHLQKIAYMYIGPIIARATDTIKNDFVKNLIIKFTNFKPSMNSLSYVNIIDELIQDEKRNNMIINDLINEYKNNKHIVVLSSRIEHISKLYEKIKNECGNSLIIHGGSDNEQKISFREQINKYSGSFIIFSTGQFIGEGFDESKLDTLFIITPFRWKGTLQQYVGRLNRKIESTKHLLVYDYVDNNTRMLTNMYYARLKGYKELNYSIVNKINNIDKCLFGKEDYFSKLCDDIKNAQNEIIFIIDHAQKHTIDSLLKLVHVKYKIFIRSNIKCLNDSRCILVDKYVPNAIVIDYSISWHGDINPFDIFSKGNVIVRIVDNDIATKIIQEVKTMNNHIQTNLFD